MSDRIVELAERLDKLGIEYVKRSLFGQDDQLKFEWCDGADIVHHHLSYGNEDGLFEIMGYKLMTDAELQVDSVVGYITIDDAVRRISEAWAKYKNENAEEAYD